MAKVSLPPIPDKVVYNPSDMASFTGLDSDSVTRHIKNRPSLFPAPKKVGKRKTIHEWTREQFEDVAHKICALSEKARQFVAGQPQMGALAV